MRQDSRLSRVLHAFLHLDGLDRPATSDEMGEMLATNPAVVRRMMGGLREAGIVASVKGHGGGWTLTRPVDQITLLDVYEALGRPTLFALGPADDTPSCLLERGANAALTQALARAQEVFRNELSAVTVADVGRDAARSGEINPPVR